MNPAIQNRKKVAAIVDYLKDMEQVECPVEHRFAPGVYMRQVSMPTGLVVVGKIHATEHFNIIMSGSATVITIDDDGQFERVLVKAGDTFVSHAGVQKVLAIHERCVWQTVHVTEKTDLSEIEKDVILDSYDQLTVDKAMDEIARFL